MKFSKFVLLILFSLFVKCLARNKVQNYFASSAGSVDELDGLSITFDTWRFNLRKSNTEPLVRLNVETRGDHALLQDPFARQDELDQTEMQKDAAAEVSTHRLDDRKSFRASREAVMDQWNG